MKSYWVDTSKPSPCGKPSSINGIIYTNCVHAQTHLGRALTRQEVAALIKKMKEKGLLTSKRDNWSLTDSYLGKLKKGKVVSETKP
jgi:hypothetical protein